MKKFKISELAKIKDIDTQTLRHYDKIGLLTPSFVDPKTGYRYYTLDQFHLLDIIKFYKLAGFSLVKIKETLEVEDIDERIALIKAQNNVFLEKIKEYKAVVEGMNNVIEKVENTRREYSLLGRKPIVMIHPGFKGYIQEMEPITSNYDYELYLKKIREDIVSQGAMYHNQGAITVGDLSKYIVGEPYNEKMILEASPSAEISDKTEFFPVGLCIRSIHKGDKEFGNQTIQDMMDFAGREGYRLKNKVIFRVIVDSYFVLEDEEYMVEIIMPIEVE